MKYKLGTLLLTAILLIVYFTYQNSSPSKSILIGAIIPETGFGAYWGAPVRKGIELAQQDLTKKYPEKNITIKIEDSQSSPTSGVTAAQKLINIDHADALYSEFSGVSAAISPVAKAAGKVLVYSTFNQKIADDNSNSIKTFISFTDACDMFAQRLNDPRKKVMIISSISDTAPYCAERLRKYIPESNIKVIEGFTGTDFRTLLLQNKSFDPDYIIPIMYENGSYALIKQKNELGMRTSFFCHKQDCVTEKLLKELPHSMTDGITYFEVAIDTDFAKRLTAIYPDISKDDIQAAANSYQSIMVLGEALVSCSQKNTTCIIDTIANQKNVAHSGYLHASFTDRILDSDLLIGVVKDGIGVIEN